MYISQSLLNDCLMKLPKFTRLLYWVGKHNTKIFFFFFYTLIRSLRIQTQKIWQIKWKWIRSINCETVWIHFLSEFSVLLSSRNFAAMWTWHNDFYSLQRFLRIAINWFCFTCKLEPSHWIGTGHMDWYGHADPVLLPTVLESCWLTTLIQKCIQQGHVARLYWLSVWKMVCCAYSLRTHNTHCDGIQ